MKPSMFAGLALSVVIGGGCLESDSGGTVWTEDFGSDARNVGVTVVNDLDKPVSVTYWTLPDPSPEPGGTAFRESVKLLPGESQVILLAFGTQDNGAFFGSVDFWKDSKFGTVNVLQGNPQAHSSDVKWWSTVSAL